MYFILPSISNYSKQRNKCIAFTSWFSVLSLQEMSALDHIYFLLQQSSTPRHQTSLNSIVYHIVSLYLLSYCWFKVSQIYIQTKLTTQLPVHQRKDHENVNRNTTAGCKTVKHYRTSVLWVFSNGPTHFRTLLQFHFTSSESGLLYPIDKSSPHISEFKASGFHETSETTQSNLLQKWPLVFSQK